MKKRDIESFMDRLKEGEPAPDHAADWSETEREIAQVWNDLGELEASEVEDRRAVSEFQHSLNAYRQGFAEASKRKEGEPGAPQAKRESGSPLLAVFRYGLVAGVAAVLTLSLFMAYTMSERNEELEERLASTQETLAMALLEQPSAPKRLAGLETASKVSHPSSRLRDMVVRTFDADTNLNVRLAAVSALKALPRDEALSILLERMEHEASPLVQMEILRQVLELVDEHAESALVERINEMPLEPRVRSALSKGDDRI
ncbi:hypothetical protein [Pelagicoccus sp. SDUM812003]|uniref:hypothetical protein n=1 Tax=Pelagicoccus sp. SDUM812003 TaxID=3041267 RepID=UPI00280CF1EE|nr:hypothetical protein [Pelagicoccus sp. SDUM812003]MDQ8203411.1 hypothetical protein [Pelagicoccus sp. SDUM812003]